MISILIVKCHALKYNAVNGACFTATCSITSLNCLLTWAMVAHVAHDSCCMFGDTVLGRYCTGLAVQKGVVWGWKYWFLEAGPD